MSAPRVSVCIPAYECAEALQETLDSVWSQDFADFEAVIVDDGSRDETAAVIAAQTDSRLRWFRHERNLGQAATVGETVARARAPLVKFLDSDDVLRSDCIGRMVAAMDERPSAALAFCRREIMAVRPDDRRTQEWTAVAGDLHLEFGPPPPFEDGGQALARFVANGLATNWLAEPAGTMARRADVLAVGGYNSRVRQNNDFDLWVRLLTRGDLVFIDEPLYRYRLDFGGVTGSSEGWRQWLDPLWTIEALLASGAPDPGAVREARRWQLRRAVRRGLLAPIFEPRDALGRWRDLRSYFTYRAMARAGRGESLVLPIDDLATTA